MKVSNLLSYAREGGDVLLGGLTFARPESPNVVEYRFTIAQPELKKHTLISLSFLPHGVAVDPNNPQRIVVCEKIGPGAAVVDIDSRDVEYITSPEGREFYGHCAFSADGTSLFTTETYTDSFDGAIVERDGNTLLERGEFPSFGSSPHECQLQDGGDTMVVTNGGGNMEGSAPNIAYIDMRTRELLEVKHPTSPRLNTGHFYVSANNDLVVVSAPRLGVEPMLGGVSIQPHGEALETVTTPKEVVENMLGESLSVAIHGNVALVTHPEGHMVSFWDTSTRRFIKSIAYESPRGVTLSFDERYFIVTYGASASTVNIDTETLEPDEGSVYPNSMLAGSHMYNWTRIVSDLGYA